MRRILLVDDDPNIAQAFLDDVGPRLDAEVLVATSLSAGMDEFRALIAASAGREIGIDAAVLDFWLNRSETQSSIPLYRLMEELSPAFARGRVCLSTSLSEASARERFDAASASFPEKYVRKGNIIELMGWLRPLLGS